MSRGGGARSSGSRPGAEGLLVRAEEPDGACAWWDTAAPLAAEFLGAFLLTFTFVCNSSAGDHTYAVTSSSLMAGVVTYATGHISGGNINPSVSIALCLAGRQSAWTTAQLCSVQCFGGLCAGLLCHVLGFGAAVDLGPRPGFSWGAAMLVEVLYTAMICFVYLNVAASRGNNPLHKANGFVGLAVAFCFLAGGYGAAAISGTVMNPATAIGMQLVDFSDGRTQGWGFAYLPFEVAGACLAAGSYRLVRPAEFTIRLSHRWTPGAQAAIFQQAPVSARLAAEFVGTFYVVFTKALNHIGKSRAEAWSVGAAYGCMAYALRGVSGGHFNPAVSFASALTSRRFLSKLDCVRYIAVQVWAGLAASAVFAFLHDGSSIHVYRNEKYSWWSAAVGELLFTFLLAYANLATSVGGTFLAGLQSNAGGVAVGFAAVAGGLSLEGVSGAVMNPAMAVGFSGLNALAAAAACSVKGIHAELDKCDFSSRPVLHYTVFEMSGALLAAAAFQVTHGRLLRSCALEDDDAEKEPFSGREGSQRERL